MRAREIERWLVKILEHGATDLVDAEIAKHIVRIWEGVEKDSRLGQHDVRECAVTLPILRARAIAQARLDASRQAPADAPGSSPASP